MAGSNTKEFLDKLSKKNFNKLDYSKVIYVRSKIKVIVICKEHGEFKITPSHLLEGQGCRKCGMKNSGGWSYTIWENKGKNSKNFDSYKVYILRCWNESEEFYKIGKTFYSTEKRFLGDYRMPYSYEIVKIFEGSAKDISKLEKQLQKDNKKNKYTPKIKFKGYTECFLNVKY